MVKNLEMGIRGVVQWRKPSMENRVWLHSAHLKAGYAWRLPLKRRRITLRWDYLDVPNPIVWIPKPRQHPCHGCHQRDMRCYGLQRGRKWPGFRTHGQFLNTAKVQKRASPQNLQKACTLLTTAFQPSGCCQTFNLQENQLINPCCFQPAQHVECLSSSPLLLLPTDGSCFILLPPRNSPLSSCQARGIRTFLHHMTHSTKLKSVSHRQIFLILQFNLNIEPSY